MLPAAAASPYCHLNHSVDIGVFHSLSPPVFFDFFPALSARLQAKKRLCTLVFILRENVAKVYSHFPRLVYLLRCFARLFQAAAFRMISTRIPFLP